MTKPNKKKVKQPMVKGIYVDRFREGTRSISEITAMMRFVNTNAFTDVFVHVPLIFDPDFDGADYILKTVKPTQRIHIHISTLLIGRAGWPEKLTTIPRSWQMEEVFPDPRSTRVYLDPTIPAVQDYIVSRCVALMRRYNAAGLHFDRLRYPSYLVGKGTIADKQAALTQLISRISAAVRAERPGIILSLAVKNNDNAKDIDLCDYDLWYRQHYIDVLCPMFFMNDRTRLDDRFNAWVAKGYNMWFVMGWMNKALANYQGKDTLTYSYAMTKQMAATYGH
jgi:hypothetical protein